MVDSPTTRNRFRKQEVGTNNNTWGTKLNEVLDCVDQVVDGVESVDLGASASYTLTTTDYTTADQAKNRVLVCSNVNSSGSDVIVPSVEHVYGVRNSGSATITVKTAAGTGVAIPASRFAWVYCDGTNVVSGASTSLPVAFVPSLANDAVTKDYVDDAIASSTIPGADGTVKVDAAAASVYLGAALTEGTGIDIADNGDSLGLSVDTTELEEFLALTGKITATLSSGTTAMTARRRYRISSTATGTLPTMIAGDFVIVEFTNGAGVTATVARNSQTIDGTAEDDTYIGQGTETPVVRYDYASAGAVTSRLIEVIP